MSKKITLSGSEIGPMSVIKVVMLWSRVDTLLELCSPFLNGDNSTFNMAIASGPFPQNEYRSPE